MGKAEFGGISGKGVNLLFGNRVGDRFVLVVSRGVVVGHADYLFRTQAFYAAAAHAVKSLGRGHFVAIKTVDIKLYGAVLYLLYHMFIPDFVEESIHKVVSDLIPSGKDIH
jgi:hypothetical protein